MMVSSQRKTFRQTRRAEHAVVGALPVGSAAFVTWPTRLKGAVAARRSSRIPAAAGGAVRGQPQALNDGQFAVVGAL